MLATYRPILHLITMGLVISRIILTAVLALLAYLVWTRNVDVWTWTIKKAESVLPIVEQSKLKKTNYQVLVDLGLDPLDVRKIPSSTKDWRKCGLRIRFLLQKLESEWSDHVIVGLIYFSGDALYNTESRIPTWAENAIDLGNKPPPHRLLHHTIDIGSVNSAQYSSSGWLTCSISVDHLPWKAAVYVLGKDSEPEWFQLVVDPETTPLIPKPGQGVQIRELAIQNAQRPIVSVGENSGFLPEN